MKSGADRPRKQNKPFRRPQRLSISLIIAFWLAHIWGNGIVARPVAAGKTETSQEFFQDSAVRSFQFEIPPEGIASLRRSPRDYVRGTAREGGRVLTNAGFHLKGMGSFRTVDEKASFAVKFDEFTKDQEYAGLTKLMFNNAVQDPTYLAEWLATGLFRDAGVPAARVTHARVHLNGADLGLYVVIEAMNKRFLKQHFSSAKGNLYETYVRDIDGPLDQDNGDSTDQADVQALLRACAVPEPAQRWKALGRVLDLDRFLSFAAMENLVGHWDGYTIHTNNYRLYHDPASDKMVFITHGLDWAFRRPNISIEPPFKSLVGRAVFQTDEGRKLYRERLGTLYTNVFRLPVITDRMEQGLLKLRSAGLTAPELARVERTAASIRERIQLRHTRVAEQLAGMEPPQTRFDSEGSARLNGWRDESDRGNPILDQPEFEGRRTLRIRAEGGRSRASWRTQVFLLRGRYRFEGKVRTESVVSGSVRLRISGAQRSSGIGGTSPWRMLSHEFEVTDDAVDVEFVCEFNGMSGDAWFDTESLTVRKLP